MRRRLRVGGQRLGRVDVDQGRVAVRLDLDHGVGVLRRSGGGHPRRPRRLHLARKKARAHSTGLPRLPRQVGTTMPRPSTGSNAAISRSIRRGVTRGMSPRQTTAPAASRGRAARPARREVLSPASKSGLTAKLTLSPRSAWRTSCCWWPEHHDHRRRARGQRRLDHVAHHGLARDGQQQLVGAAHAARLAGGQDQGGGLGRRRRAPHRRAAAGATGSRSAGRRRPSP